MQLVLNGCLWNGPNLTLTLSQSGGMTPAPNNWDGTKHTEGHAAARGAQTQGLCKDGVVGFQRPHLAIAEGSAIPAQQSLALVQLTSLSSVPIAAGAGDHTDPAVARREPLCSWAR